MYVLRILRPHNQNRRVHTVQILAKTSAAAERLGEVINNLKFKGVVKPSQVVRENSPRLSPFYRFRSPDISPVIEGNTPLFLLDRRLRRRPCDT